MQDKVREFHSKFGVNVGESVGFRDVDLRIDLINEEVMELKDAVEDEDMVGAADALADILYVVFGAAVTWGIPLESVFNIVHEHNMRKVGGAIRDDGKILKPKGWIGPEEEIRELLGIVAKDEEEVDFDD